MSEQLDKVHDKLDAILKVLNGNGKLGVVAKITILWNSIMFIVCAVAINFLRSL